MAKRKSTAAQRLRQLKTQHQRQVRRLTEEINEQLSTFEHSLQQQLYGQAFYHEALMNLLTSENEPDSDSLIGAMIFQRWLNTTGRELKYAIATYRTTQL